MSGISAAQRRAFAQEAHTLRLLGVDGAPVFRSATSRPPVPSVQHARSLVPDVDPAADPEAPLSPVVVATEQLGKQARLDALRARYEADAPHDLFVTDHHTIVFGEGDPDARLMFVGEAPGAEEDRTGRPFVGRAGELLTKMIGAMGLRRDAVYIANVLKTRPPDNQTPTPEESLLCAPYLYEQIRIIGPEVIVTLGLPASRLLLRSDDAMGRLRGVWAEFSRDAAKMPESGHAGGAIDAAISGEPVGPVSVLPTYHPAYLLRSYTADNRGKVW
jgi:DNA polymerase